MTMNGTLDIPALINERPLDLSEVPVLSPAEGGLPVRRVPTGHPPRERG